MEIDFFARMEVRVWRMKGTALRRRQVENPCSMESAGGRKGEMDAIKGELEEFDARALAAMSAKG